MKIKLFFSISNFQCLQKGYEDSEIENITSKVSSLDTNIQIGDLFKNTLEDNETLNNEKDVNEAEDEDEEDEDEDDDNINIRIDDLKKPFAPPSPNRQLSKTDQQIRTSTKNHYFLHFTLSFL